MVSQLKIRLAEKEVREKRRIPLSEVERETQVARSTLLGMANNTIRRVPLDELAKLCTYFRCNVGDLLTIVEDEVPA